jgi:Fe-S oxidoreductase
LFDAVDRHNGDVRKVTAAESEHVADTCYQCKLCYVKCPYTPDDGHSFQLDFPRLLLRANAIRKKERGIDLRGRLLSRPETANTLGSLTADMANWGNRQPLMRIAMEKTIGIHRDKVLPDFHAQAFEEWRSNQGVPPGDPNLAVLFHTCFVNHNNPQIGKDAIEVYSHNGISLGCPKQNCCGMPALEAGDVALAKKNAEANVASLYAHAAAGKKIVAINPTCSYMLRKEYGELVGTAAARAVAGATMDLCEFLWQRKQEGTLKRDFRSSPGRVAYHVPCHLKAQNIGFRSRDLMRLIPGAEVRMVEQCSGHDGTWAMKKEFFPLSMLAGRKAFNEMREADAEVMATDCPLAAIQFDQAIGTRPVHPIQIIARAYRQGGFANNIEPEEKS